MTSKIELSIAELTGKIQAIKDALKEKILSLPQNPRIKELGHGCFTVSSHDLIGGAPWTPEYHNFRGQYQALAELVDNVEPKNLVTRLTEALDRGSVGRDGKSSPFQRIPLHPDVVAHMRGLL